MCQNKPQIIDNINNSWHVAFARTHDISVSWDRVSPDWAIEMAQKLGYSFAGNQSSQHPLRGAMTRELRPSGRE